MKCGMGQMKPSQNEELTEGEGYTIIEGVVSHDLIKSIRTKYSQLRMVRASAHGKQYAEGNAVKNLPDIAVWWSQDLSSWPEVQEIDANISPIAQMYLPAARFYCSDIVVIEAKSNSHWINPHVDTPHRFKRWNYDTRLLGIQCVIPLVTVDHLNGATGLVVGSQKRDHNIKLCYEGYYDSDFRDTVMQPSVNMGDVLMYNARVLHSSMPNHSSAPRPALLINYLHSDLINEVGTIDNIWASNA